MTRRIAWPLLFTLTTALTFLFSASPAQAATGCSFVAPTATVTIDPGASATLKRSGPAIQLNGANCGAATVTNTDKISVTGAAGSETFTVDLSGGPLAPGAGAEATGAAEIELEVNLGPQGIVVPDKLVIQGTGSADTYRLGSAGINLNNDDDADVTGLGGGAIATISAELFSVLGAGGNDTISGQGALAGVTAPVPYPLPLDLEGGDQNDTLTGGNYTDTITGGPGADIEAGGDNIDAFVEDAAVNGNDSFSGGPGSPDRLDYSARTIGVNVSLDGVANDGQSGLELDNVQNDVESFALGSGNDTFTGGSGAQLRVSAGAGTDTITGGTGSEALYGGANDDTIHGGLGNDLIYGGMGDDHLFGEDGYDKFFEDADDGVPAVTTANGEDDMVGGALEDTVIYAERGAGTYAITLDNVANDGLDSVLGGAAEEGDNVHDDVEDITGDAGGTNRITASSAPNVIQGGTGNDVISSLAGNDTIGGSYGNDTIDGGADNDILNGFYGDDTLLGQAGMDSLFGQGDNDTITGGSGNDNEVGELGNDTLTEDGTSANGADILSAGAGTDTLSYKTRTIRVVVDLDAASADDGEDANGDGVADEGDTVTPDFEKLEGGNGNDKLTGQLGSVVANTLTGNGGPDVLTGNEGDDVLDGGLGGDTLNGNAGVDTSTYAGRTTRLRVDIGGALDGSDADNNGVAEEGDTTAGDVENLIGGEGPDTLIGSGGDNVLTGNGNQDVLQGLNSLDTLDGGPGTDKLVGGPATDIEHGGLNNDTFDQGGTADGADALFGEDGVDTVDYSARPGSVAVRLDGIANDGADANHDGVGLEEADNVRSDVENVRGGSDADTLVGSDLANNLSGRGGDDYLDGGLGPDAMDGGAGVDAVSYELRGGVEPVRVTAGDNAANDGGFDEHDNVLDTVENLRGGQGGDELTGNASANLLEGGDGNDIFDGQGGADVMQGGPGIDLADYQARTVSVRVTLDDVANDGTDTSLDGFSEESDNVKSDIENVWSGSAPDALTGDADDNKLFGRKGDDVLLDGQGGSDLILGEEGNDLALIGGGGVDTIVGDVGDDDIFEGAAPNGADQIVGGPGAHDSVHYSGRSNPVAIRLDDSANDGDFATNEGDNVHTDVEDAVGGSAGDALQGSSSANGLIGGPGNDGIHGNDGADAVSGGTGNDALFGDAGKDTLNGGPGNDAEQGGPGFDVMKQESGANGADTFSDSDEDALVDYSARTASLTVDIDGVADDGAAGENDNVTLSIPRVNGGKGTDTLTGGRPPNTSTWLDGGPGNDTVNAVNGDLIAGGAGNDTLNGGPQHDILVGGAGNDMELGNGGDDWFWEDGECNFPCAPNGADQLHGGGGLDRVEYTGRAAPVTVTIDGVANDGAAGEGDNVFTDVEDLRGGHGDDTLTGSSIGNRIDGCYGSDSVNGGLGDDILGGDNECIGIAGSDTIHGDDGDDIIYGDSTLVNADDKPDQLFGDNGDDDITGGGAADAMNGGAGKDIFHAKDGFVDTVDGGPDADAMADSDPTDVLLNIP
jgi:Ca2+-binding RTX toxin-like protein